MGRDGSPRPDGLSALRPRPLRHPALVLAEPVPRQVQPGGSGGACTAWRQNASARPGSAPLPLSPRTTPIPTPAMPAESGPFTWERSQVQMPTAPDIRKLTSSLPSRQRVAGIDVDPDLAAARSGLPGSLDSDDAFVIAGRTHRVRARRGR